jgi:hypothetical protein
MILVPLVDLKSLKELAACGTGTSDRRYRASAIWIGADHLPEMMGMMHKKRLASAYFIGKTRRTSMR